MTLVECLRSRNPETDPDCHQAADELERWLFTQPGAERPSFIKNLDGIEAFVNRGNFFIRHTRWGSEIELSRVQAIAIYQWLASALSGYEVQRREHQP